MSVESNKHIIERFIEDFWNQGNFAAADAIVASSMLCESMKRANGLFHDVFPDVCFNIQEIIGEEDKVVARYTMSGSYKPHWFGFAQTVRRFEVNYIAIYQLNESKIKGFFFMRDTLILLRQLGVLAILNIMMRYGKQLHGS